MSKTTDTRKIPKVAIERLFSVAYKYSQISDVAKQYLSGRLDTKEAEIARCDLPFLTDYILSSKLMKLVIFIISKSVSLKHFKQVKNSLKIVAHNCVRDIR